MPNPQTKYREAYFSLSFATCDLEADQCHVLEAIRLDCTEKIEDVACDSEFVFEAHKETAALAYFGILRRMNVFACLQFQPRKEVA